MSILNTTHKLICTLRGAGQIQRIGLLVLVLLIITGCGFGAAPPRPEKAQPAGDEAIELEEERNTSPDALADPAAEPAVMDRALAVEAAKEEAAPLPTATYLAAESGAGGSIAGGEGVEAAAEPLPSAGLADADESVTVESEIASETERPETIVAGVQQSEPLRAGEVDDNAHWDDYLLYRRNYRGPAVHDRDVTERYLIEVNDGQGNPVLDAKVRIFLNGQQQRREIYSGRTYANGRVLFHPSALEIPPQQADRFLVEVQKDNLLEQFTLTRFDAQASTGFTDRWTVTLDTQTQFDSINLDVLFLIDATGSMADEIAKIQSTIFEVAARIDALPEHPNVRYGLVTYRDRGDSFVTRSYEFTPDVRDFSKNLNMVYADGGGDYPESLNEGLHVALDNVEWRGQDTVQLIFLIADAPPHLDYAQDYDYAVEMDNAARRGIKIFPIASSGLDDQGEYIFRQLAQYTQGRFIFLTYEGPTNSGAPGDVTTHHVDDYSVENLDDLLVRLVEEELAFQNGGLAQRQ